MLQDQRFSPARESNPPHFQLRNYPILCFSLGFEHKGNNCFPGCPGGARTHDPRFNRPLLCQLSYRAIFILIFYIYYTIFFIQNQKRFFIHTRRFFMIFYAALPLSYSPHIEGERRIRTFNTRHPKHYQKNNFAVIVFLYLTYILYNIFL